MALDIIGPGFGRTGTHALKLALEQLGFGPCHHMYEVRDNPAQLDGWAAAARGEKVDWDQVLKGYRSQVDWPGARYWRELIAAYPSAKVVLTVRDPDEWYDSMKTTIIPFVATRGTHDVPFVNALLDMGHETVMQQVFGGKLDDRDAAIARFRQHIAEVQAEVPKERLLTFNVREGWKPLCDFLGVAVPDTPFPRTNSSKAFVQDEWQMEKA